MGEMALHHKIGFIGSGQMAMALAKGFMASGLVAPNQVMASAPSDINLLLWRELGASTTHSNADVIKACDVVFLAVKPQMLNKVVQDLWVCPAAEELRKMESKLFVSVLAGVTTETLAKLLAQVVAQPRVIRANPNTPAMVGCGASAFSLGSGSTAEDGEVVRQLLNSVGLCECIPESQQDAFTGLVTSGPAYIYTIIEGLSDGGVRMGLPRALSARFASQMVLGAAKMSLESGKHTGQLKDEVTSPGGTTIRGIQVLDRAGVRGILMDAVQASAERAQELGRPSKP